MANMGDLILNVRLSEQDIDTIIQRVKQECFTLPMEMEKPIFAARSGHWPTVRNQHLEKNPTCAVCGGEDNLQVHHIKPYHLHPELELDPNNLLTLCEPSSILHINCHLVWGHLGNWKSFNPMVPAMALAFLTQMRHRKIQ